MACVILDSIALRQPLLPLQLMESQVNSALRVTIVLWALNIQRIAQPVSITHQLKKANLLIAYFACQVHIVQEAQTPLLQA